MLLNISFNKNSSTYLSIKKVEMCSYRVFLLLPFFCIIFFSSFSQNNASKGDKLDIKDSVQIKEEVLDHLNKIFQAFVDKDTTTIREAHSLDWTGFQQFSDLKRNRDGYMEPIRRALPSMTGYHIDDIDVQIYSDIVLVYYLATIRNSFQGSEVQSQIKSLDVYQKRQGNWEQIGSHVASKITLRQFIQMMQSSQLNKSN
jgi:Domain of unknown function (DUF4440)